MSVRRIHTRLQQDSVLRKDAEKACRLLNVKMSLSPL